MSLSPALTPDDVDAPHIASIVEQFHGPWRGRGTTADTKLSKFQEVRVSRSARLVFVCTSFVFFANNGRTVQVI